MSGDVQVRFCESQWVRFPLATHLVLLCRSEAEAKRGLVLVQQWTAEAGLMLHPEKTRIVDANQPGGFEFLGYHFDCGQKWPRRKSLKKFKDTIRAKTKRTNGQSLQVIIANVNRSARGWFGYFKHSHHYTFDPLDRLLRVRLRSILRRRSGRVGRARGRDSQRWLPTSQFRSGRQDGVPLLLSKVCVAALGGPLKLSPLSESRRQIRQSFWENYLLKPNAFFAAHGLFSFCRGPRASSSIPNWVNHQLESRMRENRLSGSEGGGVNPIAAPYPY